jgi:hypothetical protein
MCSSEFGWEDLQGRVTGVPWFPPSAVIAPCGDMLSVPSKGRGQLQGVARLCNAAPKRCWDRNMVDCCTQGYAGGFEQSFWVSAVCPMSIGKTSRGHRRT